MKTLLLLALLLAACAGAPTAPAPQNAAKPTDIAAIVAADMEDQIAYMTRFGDEACACSDKVCATEVDGRVRKALEGEVAEELYTPEEGDKYQPPYSKRLGAAYKRYVDCLTALEVPPTSFGVLSLWSFERIERFACSCTDATCAREADKRFVAWRTHMNTPGTKEDLARVKASSHRFHQCVTAAYAASRQERGQDLLDELIALRDRGCACEDDACVVAMVEELDVWVENSLRRPASEAITAALKPVAAELFACVPYERPKVRAALAELSVLRDRACACTNADCANAVGEAFYDLGRRHQDTDSGDAAIAKFLAIYGEMNACITAAGGDTVGAP